MRAWNWNITDSKKTISDLITPRYFPIWQSKEMSHDFVRGQSVAETCFSHWGYLELTMRSLWDCFVVTLRVSRSVWGTCAIMIRLHHANIRTFTITALFIILDTIWMPQNVIIIKPAIRTLSSQVISCSHANRLASENSRGGMRLCRWQLELIIHRPKIRFLWFI